MPGKHNKKSKQDADELLRVIVAGPSEWRVAVVDLINADGRFIVTDEFEADLNIVDVGRVTAADVLVATVDPHFTPPALNLAIALQKKILALAIVMVLPPMFRDELEGLERYRSIWSLVASETCEDAGRFVEAIWSASRGMTWTDHALYTRLNEVRAASARRSTPVAGFDQ